MHDPPQGRPLAEWAVAYCTYPGEDRSGDLHCVIETPKGVIAAVVDGLGHGEEAWVAAKRAVHVLSDGKIRTVPLMFEDCHAALKGTRGAVMSAAWISATKPILTWLGVGNVDGYLLRGGAWKDHFSKIKAADENRIEDGGNNADDSVILERESLLMRSGVVGYRIPSLRPVSLPLRAGDTLILATDGISLDFQRFTTGDLSPQAIADDILAEFRKGTDDALVLVVRYTGGSTDE